MGESAFFDDFIATVYYVPGKSGWSSPFAALPAAPQYSYTTNNGDITITNYSVPDSAVTIPTTINGLTVTSIGSYAFNHCASLTNVAIPGGVTNIEEAAFADCAFLTAITVDGQNAFYSSLNGVLFDGSQTTLVEYPAGLHGSYSIPNGVTNIGAEAFAGCYALTNVTIPNAFNNIGTDAFAFCAGLISLTIPGGVTNLGNYAFESCTSLTGIAIPGSVNSIGGEAFDNCASLTSITIANGVTSIGAGAFSGCASLTNVAIPGSVTNIGQGSFLECSNLASVAIPAGVSDVGLGMFAFCTSLTSVTIPTSVTNIESYAFEFCASLASITISSGVTGIGASAFFDCTVLTNVYFIGNAPTLGSSVFFGDNHATVYYLSGTTGWVSPFAGLPAVLWNPQIQSGGGGFGLQKNQFGFNIVGTADIPIVVEVCTDLGTPVWTPLQTLALTNGLYHFNEAARTNSFARFYRSHFRDNTLVG